LRLILSCILASTTTVAEQPEVPEEPSEEVVVTGSRVKERLIDTTVATELINQREIRESGAENVTELLEEQPGVEFERLARGTGLRLMGLDPEHVLILVDGERVTGRVGGGIDPTRFTTDNISQVEIVKGAGSAIYGSEAIGGVVNIITRAPTKPFEASVRGTYGLFNTVDTSATAGGKLGPVATLFSGGYHRSDGFTIERDEDQVEQLGPNLQTTGPKFDSWDISNTTFFELADYATLRARADYRSLTQKADDQKGRTRISKREQNQSSWTAALSPEIRFGDRGLFKSTISFSNYEFDIHQEADNARDLIQQSIGQLSFQIDDEILETHIVSLGLEGIIERQGGSTGTESAPTDFFEGGTQYRERAAIFLQDDWTPISDEFLISVVPSIRVDIDSQFGSVATPRFAVRYDPFPELAVRMSYGLGFRAPTFEELYLDFLNPGSNYRVEGNEELEPEHSQAFNLTGTVRPWDWISATATFYYINLDNLIDTQNLGRGGDGLSLFKYVNVESARSTGTEATVDLYPIKELGFSVGYVFNATRDRATNRPLDGRARHKGTARITFRYDEWGLSASARSQIYFNRVFFRDLDGDGDTERVPSDMYDDPYATLDFRVEKTLFEWFAIFAGFENILGFGDPDYTPITPRSFYGGLSAQFHLEDEI
jgi:outer membrane receptor for ferrienterochelin and colicins